MEEWKNPDTITSWIIITSVLVSFLILAIIQLARISYKKTMETIVAEANAKVSYQKDLTKAIIETQENERQRIAADLHDSLINELRVIIIEEEINHPKSQNIQKMRECITGIRRISHDLSPPLLNFTPLPDLLKELLHPLSFNLKINYKFDIRVDKEQENEFKLQIVRITQEVMNNVLKHSNASQLNLHYKCTNQGIAIQFKDNGIGFHVNQQLKGLGLKNIDARINHINGAYKLRSKHQHGTSLFLIFKN